MSRAASQGLQSSRRECVQNDFFPCTSLSDRPRADPRSSSPLCFCSDLESLGYILLSFLAPLPWAPLARQMDVQYMQAGGRVTPVVTDLLRRIEASKEGYIRGARERRVVDLRRGEEAVSPAAIRMRPGTKRLTVR